MIWKKIKEPKKGELTILEKAIIDCLVEKLPPKYCTSLVKQLDYLKLQKRIDYNKDCVTELYPEQFGIIPKEVLFERNEEFRLAVIKFELNDIKYTCEIHMALGQLFDLKIRPRPIKIKGELNIVVLNMKIEENLSENIY